MEINSRYEPEQPDIPIAECAVSQPAEARSPVAKNRVLHWMSVYTIMTMIYLSVAAMFGLLFPQAGMVQVDKYNSQSAQNALSGMLLLMMVLCPHSILFINLTYKRFAYSKPWKAFTLVNILAIPAYITFSYNAWLLNIGGSASSLTSIPGLASYAMFAFVVMLIPLAFFVWALWKEHQRPKHRQGRRAPKTPAAHKKSGRHRDLASLIKITPVVGGPNGLHWIMATLIALAAAVLIQGILSVPDWWTSAFQNAEHSALKQTAVRVSFVIVTCPMILGFSLWIRLTWKRYAASVNWLWCSIAVYSYSILSAYGGLSLAFENLVKEQFLPISATLPSAIPAAYYVLSLLGLLLPMLYFWRVINKTKKIV